MPFNKPNKPLPSIFISKQDVSARVSNFMNTKHNLLSDAIGKQETRAAWYSLEQFEELMREMYYLNADGLRVYFGAYDREHLQYPDQMTVIFVPTYLDELQGSHADIIIDDMDDYTSRSVNSEMQMSKFKNLDSIGLCPPSCGIQTLSYPIEELSISE